MTRSKSARLLAGDRNPQNIKIVMLGAGSEFTQTLVTDILNVSALRGEIALVDIDEERLKLASDVSEKLVDAFGLENRWTVTASTDRRAALKAADYLVNCIEVSGVMAVKNDYQIPLKYGVDQCIGDTIGPGGLMKALRTIPTFLEVLRDAERLCPEALVLNYTNPMGMLCLAAARASGMKVVGLCHSVQRTSHVLSQYAEVPYAEMTWNCAGINHLAWFVTLAHQGRDLYPVLMQKAREAGSFVYESDPVRCDIMLHFGAFVTESSGHLSEYLPYYRKRQDLRDMYLRDGYRGESGFYAKNWPTWRERCDEQRRLVIRGDDPLSQDRSWEYASWIIEAHQTNRPYAFHGNVMNRSLIDNLPYGECVEVPVLVNQNGISPCRFGQLPSHMAAVCRSNMAMIELAATAALEHSREAAVYSLLLDPLSAAVCSPSEIAQMTNELIDAEIDMLPGF
jgi:alpha-galactosidase